MELAGERAVVPLSRSIACSAPSRGKGPDRVPTQVVARLDGIITPSWMAAGTATLVSTRTRTRIASLGRGPGRAESRSLSRRAGARDFRLSRNAAGDVEPSLASGPPAVPNQLPGDSSRPEQPSLPIGGPQPRICLSQQHLQLFLRRARRRPPRPIIWALRPNDGTPAGMSQDELIEREAGPRGKGFMTVCLHKATRDAMLSIIARSYSLRGSWRS